MPLTLTAETNSAARPIHVAESGDGATLPQAARDWATATGFAAKAGEVLLVPDETGEVGSAILGIGKPPRRGDRAAAEARRAMLAGALAQKLPAGDWRFADAAALDPALAGLAAHLGGYDFRRYKTCVGEGSADGAAKPEAARLHLGEDVDLGTVTTAADATTLVRDLINTPANDMGPADLEAAARTLADRFGASLAVTRGEDLIAQGFPLIHAVGRASTEAPRLLDLTWGRADDPKVTLVGKGVVFDTGGLDIKPASNMILMKKDMGGAAHALGLAQLIMARKLPVRLRMLVPAVENAISGNAFRPSDVLTSRKGTTVEVGNTDAEGRLVLADALAYGDEEAPEIMIDMATLTGAARVALGGDLPAFFTEDDAFAGAVAAAGSRLADPVWRMPLWQPYRPAFGSKVADTNSISFDGFAGAIVAALFLEGFVEKAKVWAHLDLYGWRAKATPSCPVGGEAYAIRSLAAVIEERFPKA